MALAASGQLTPGEFAAALRSFVAWWGDASGPGQPCWQLASVRMPVTGEVLEYACLERVLSVPAGARPPQPPPAEGAAASAGDADGDEAACSPAQPPWPDGGQQQQQQQQRVHVHQYTVAYHHTYRVPALYLRAFAPDGTPLRLEALLADLPGLERHRDPGQAGWTYLTEVEHPLLRTPCAMLHPCQTAERVRLMLEGATGAAGAPGGGVGEPLLLAYMRGWLSLVAGPLGCSVVTGSFSSSG